MTTMRWRTRPARFGNISDRRVSVPIIPLVLLQFIVIDWYIHLIEVV